jgi:LmbE family N-acetylglucosaminyl deacetylase
VFGAVPEGAKKEEILFEEHDAAMTALGLDGFYALDFTDSAWQKAGSNDSMFRFWEVGPALGRAITELVKDVDVICWPTGIHHPDHRLVSRAGRNAVTGPWRTWVYDELPYFVLYPDEAMGPGSHLQLERVGSRDFYERKQRLVQCYRSQIDDALVRCVMVPERVWEVR